MGTEAVLELLIGVLVALSVPALVWSTVIVGLRKVRERRASIDRATRPGSMLD